MEVEETAAPVAAGGHHFVGHVPVVRALDGGGNPFDASGVVNGDAIVKVVTLHAAEQVAQRVGGGGLCGRVQHTAPQRDHGLVVRVKLPVGHTLPAPRADLSRFHLGNGQQARLCLAAIVGLVVLIRHVRQHKDGHTEQDHTGNDGMLETPGGRGRHELLASIPEVVIVPGT